MTITVHHASTGEAVNVDHSRIIRCGPGRRFEAGFWTGRHTSEVGFSGSALEIGAPPELLLIRESMSEVAALIVAAVQKSVKKTGFPVPEE